VGVPVPRARLIVARCPEAGTRLVLPRKESAHARARRLEPGDPVTLVDGSGTEAHGRLLRLTRSGAEILVEEIFRAAEAAVDITLLVAALRLERLSWVAEKAAELAVRDVVVVAAERAQSFRAHASVVARLRRVVQEAAKQSESARWPEIHGPISLAEAWEAPAAHRLFLDIPGEPYPSLLPPGSMRILVGPEGGWTEAERAAARERGWRATQLPAGKLRAETAAIAAVVLARAALARESNSSD